MNDYSAFKTNQPNFELEYFTKTSLERLKSAVWSMDHNEVKRLSQEYFSRWEDEGLRHFKLIYNDLRKRKKSS